MLSEGAPQPRSAWRLFWTGIVLAGTVSPLSLGVSTTAIALPSISLELSLSRTQAAWILAAYLLAQAMCVSIFGRLADLWGIRWTLWAGAALLAAGSAVAAAGDSFELMVAGRLLQGAGAGAIVVSAFGIIGVAFGVRERPRLLGTMTAFIGIVSGSGTLIGGVTTDALSWRVVIALPLLSLLCIPNCLKLAPRTPAGRGSVDVVGAALVATVAVVAVLLLESPSIHFGAPLLIAVAATGVVAAAGLAHRIRNRPDGFVPRALAGDARFILAAAACLTIFAAYVATLFAVPLLLSERHGWSSTEIGLRLLPAAAFGAGSAWIVGRLSHRTNAFRISAGLAALSALGALIGGLGNGSALASVVGLALVLAGVTGANVSLVARVPLMAAVEVRSVATGLFTLIFLIGGALGSALVAGLESPFGGGGALAAVAVFPAVGIALALASGARYRRDPGPGVAEAALARSTGGPTDGLSLVGTAPKPSG